MMFELLVGACAGLGCLASLFLLLRRGIPWIWKLSAVGVSAFYVTWFRTQLEALWIALKGPAALWVPPLGSAMLQAISVTLLVLWPIALIASLFSRSRERVAVRLQTLVLCSALFWMAFLVDAFTPPFAGAWLQSLSAWLGPLLDQLASPPVDQP